ncbi:site-specific integrase [Gottfriedia acidiceleris]|uniref:tyrosine-type recombinase/integrase n=1 Tax=Gottfriedia acidiceleris TaxID=371036 RepID=UPI002F26C66B
MGRNSRLGIFDIALDELETKKGESEQKIYNKKVNTSSFDQLTVNDAIRTVLKQMNVSGFRQRTIQDYNYYFESFVKITKVTYVHEITNDKIYMWLDSMPVSTQTKHTRLKQLKAVLSRFFNNGWLENKFWTSIRIKVDQKIKEGTTEQEISVLLSLLDYSNYVQMRDAVAVMLMWETGIRIRTLSSLEVHHIDFKTNTLNLSGELLKGRKQLKIPFSNETEKYLNVLIEVGNRIKKYYKQDNTLVFVTMHGKSVINKTSNAISKKLTKYSKQYGLKNINPHAIRRGFAKKLLKKGCNVALISKALGHSNLEVTTKYLDLTVEEVVNELREFID